MPLSSALFDDTESAPAGRPRGGLFGDNDSDDDLALLRGGQSSAAAADKTSPVRGAGFEDPWGGFNEGGAFEFLRSGPRSAGKKDADSAFGQKAFSQQDADDAFGRKAFSQKGPATYAAATTGDEDLWGFPADDVLQLNLPAGPSSAAAEKLPSASQTPAPRVPEKAKSTSEGLTTYAAAAPGEEDLWRLAADDVLQLDLPKLPSAAAQDKSPSAVLAPVPPAPVAPHASQAQAAVEAVPAPAAPTLMDEASPASADNEAAVDMEVDAGAVEAPAANEGSPPVSAGALGGGPPVEAAAAPPVPPPHTGSLPGPWCILDLPSYALPDDFQLTLLPRAGSGKPGPWQELRAAAEKLCKGLAADF